MAFTNHAEHFLTRIDRLNTQQAELALTLYRDDELLKFVLGLANLPERFQRVAISLSEGDKGPYVIVTRAGKFVTCLGEGMHLHEDQALITRHKLEQLSGQVEQVRTMFAEARAGKRQRCDQLLLRIGQAGHNVTQSEFDDLTVLTPFIGHLYINSLLQAQQSADLHFLELSRAKRFGKYLDPLLEGYWKSVWTMSHFTMLLGEEPRFLQQLFEIGDARRGEGSEETRVLFTLSPQLTGLMPWTLRGAWLAAQLPKSFLKPFKVGFCNARDPEYLKAYGFGLAAIGHRHQRYRAEIFKFLQSAESQANAGLDDFTRRVGAALASAFEDRGLEAHTKALEKECNALMDGAAKEFTASHTTKAYLKSLPPSTQLAFMLNLPLDADKAFTDTLRTYRCLPVVAKLQARDFYLPDREFCRLMKPTYDYRTGMAFISGRLDVTPPAPVRATVLPGRNERCACGSGKKFKRCCDGLRAVA